MSVPTGCAEAVARLWEYVEGGLRGSDQAIVEQHLARCLRCCGEVAFARELQGRLAAGTPTVPTDVEQRLERFLDDLEPATGWES